MKFIAQLREVNTLGQKRHQYHTNPIIVHDKAKHQGGRDSSRKKVSFDSGRWA